MNIRLCFGWMGLTLALNLSSLPSFAKISDVSMKQATDQLARLLPRGDYYGNIPETNTFCEIRSIVMQIQGQIVRHAIIPSTSHWKSADLEVSSDICQKSPACFHFLKGLSKITGMRASEHKFSLEVTRPDSNLKSLGTKKVTAVQIEHLDSGILVNVSESNGIRNRNWNHFSCLLAPDQFL